MLKSNKDDNDEALTNEIKLESSTITATTQTASTTITTTNNTTDADNTSIKSPNTKALTNDSSSDPETPISNDSNGLNKVKSNKDDNDEALTNEIKLESSTITATTQTASTTITTTNNTTDADNTSIKSPNTKALTKYVNQV
ncbi:17508_t:CDS:2 [Entrophospora sp. SA101]|nr:17508_t:CDS:2 [Entrophospora sp. SA101]